MSSKNRGSISSAIIWMILLSILLFWLGPIGTFIAGIVGGKKSGGVGNAFAAVFLPSILLGTLIFIFSSVLTGLPIIGAIVGLGMGMVSLIGIGPLLLGAVIGGVLAPSHQDNYTSDTSDVRKNRSNNVENSTNSMEGSQEKILHERTGEYDITPTPPEFNNFASRSESSHLQDTRDNDFTSSALNNEYDEYKTFLAPKGNDTIIVSSEYRSMKPLPGYLLVLNGEQTNKRLKLYGKQEISGISLTIGRDSSDWRQKVPPKKHNTHLRIKDSSKTVSRLQAELIYKDGKINLKNIGTVNPTQVNDLPLHPQSTVTLKSGMIIQAGYLRMKYIR